MEITKGPWASRKLHICPTGYVVVWPDKNGEYMRRLDTNGVFSVSDADLIAAAPDLLKACHGLLAVLKKSYIEKVPVPLDCPEARTANEAINKAEAHNTN